MNYEKIYNNLIEKAKNRTLNEYVEQHHVVPRCMGGNDENSNLVKLKPEEHYIAHLLLVKIYPKNDKLVRAAAMMVSNRPSNKLYGWLRRRFSKVQSESQSGSANTQWGTKWIHNRVLKQSKKISKNEPMPDGWEDGRIINWKKQSNYDYCPQCQNLKKVNRKFCSLSCSAKFNNSNRNTLFDNHLEAMINDYKNGMSIYKCLTSRNFCGTGKNHMKLSQTIEKLGINR